MSAASSVKQERVHEEAAAMTPSTPKEEGPAQQQLEAKAAVGPAAESSGQGSNKEGLPVCPFDDNTDMSKGVGCYFPDKKDPSKPCACGPYTSWFSLLTHVRVHHAVKNSTLAGTYLHEKGVSERTKADAEKRKADAASGVTPTKRKKAASAPASGGSYETASSAPDVVMQESAACNARGSGEHTPAVESTVWLGVMCWVKCKPCGTPVEPFECAGPCSAAPAPGSATPAATHCNVVAVGGDTTGAHDSLLEAGGQLATQQDVGMCASPLQMLAEMHKGFKAKELKEHEAETWKRRVTVVQVKQAYKDEPAPKAKREGVGRAGWPAKFNADKAELPDFQKFLVSLNTKDDRVDYLVRGAGRALGCLQLSQAEDGSECTLDDVQVLVGFYLGDQYTTLVDLPVLHPKYAWTEDLLEGLVSYCNFHTSKLRRLQITGESGPLENYRLCVESLVEALKTGHAKKCKEWKEVGYGAKAAEDREILKHYPPVKDVLQPAVREAFCIMVHLGQLFGGSAQMPSKARGLANACVAGAWSYDTFMGRKWEIEHAHASTIDKCLAEGDMKMLCTEHKAAKTYGEIIKLFSPGLFEMLKIYKTFPRPDGFPYFLVPVQAQAATISIPTSLKTFNRNLLKPRQEQAGVKVVDPTVNQNRKLWHKTLMKLTKDSTSMKKMMTILDAHGLKTQDKHYLLRDPEDDELLAKTLVEHVLGATVPFPTPAEAAAELPAWVKSGLPNFEECEAEPADEHDPDPDSEPMESWAFGACFGVKPCGELDVAPLCDVEGESEPQLALVPMRDLDEGAEVVAGKREDGGQRVEKEKSDRPSNTAQSSGDDGHRAPDKKSESSCAQSDSTEGVCSGQARWDLPKYKYIKSACARRSGHLSCDAHEAVWTALLKWQADNKRGWNERPMTKYWYYELRCDLIDRGVLTNLYCPDSCYNSVVNQLKKLAATKQHDPGRNV